LWLSPRQFLIVPIAEAQHEYALQVKKKMESSGFYVDTDLSSVTFNKKMAVARANQLYNYYLVVGAKEVEENQVNIRTRDNEVLGTKNVEEMITEMKQLVAQYK